jgi:DNA-binding response OmpR family regulator/HPt (histidine-containing phosphotransfer) domain-containing protein
VAKKILVLEDEEELGRSIKKFLEQHNYQVAYLSDIAQVESIAVEAPDLILTDLLMPRVHGFDICREVKEDPQLKDIPLIAMTAVYKEAFHKTEAMRIGVDYFLEKPFKFKTLLEKVEEFLGPTEPPVSTEESRVNKTAGAETAAAPKEKAKPVIKAKKTKSADEAAATMPSKLKPHQLPEEEEIPPEEEVSPDEEITKVSKPVDQILEMQQDYLSRLPEKIIELEQIWERIQRQRSARRDLALLRRKVHSLAGSGATFGFKQISEYAGQMEVLVDMIIVEGEKTIAQRKSKINELLDNMRHHPMVSAELELMRQMKKKE